MDRELGPAPDDDAASSRHPRPVEESAGSAATGDPRVDAALAELDALGELPVGEHVVRFERAHALLQDALADLDEGS